METYKLFLKTKPESGEFQRVHAVLVMKDGRILMRYKNGEIRPTTGGHIDPEDVNMEATLKREVWEEITCRIDKSEYLGYLEMTNEDTGEKENWARFVALVTEIMPARPDPDRENNWIYGRVLMPLDKAIEEVEKSVPLGNTVELMKYAYKVAEKKGYFDEVRNDHVEVLNPESKDAEVL